VSEIQKIILIELDDPFNNVAAGCSVELYDGTDTGLHCKNVKPREWNSKMLTCYYNTFHTNEGPWCIALICADVDSNKIVLY
jgi:hypothetical protein